MNGARNDNFMGRPFPWGFREGSKGRKISFNFNCKVNFKDVYTKLCVRSHKWKIQNISDGIFILSPGSCPCRCGTRGCLFVQILYVLYSYESGVQRQFFLFAPLSGALGRGQKVKYQEKNTLSSTANILASTRHHCSIMCLNTFLLPKVRASKTGLLDLNACKKLTIWVSQ